MLTRLGILQGDLAPGYTARLAEDGESLTVPTLDNCNYRFTTEAQRIARREVEVIDNASGEAVNIAGESAMYRTPAFAAQALVEWRASVARCRPLTWVRDIRIDSESNRINRALPIADHIDSNILFKPRGSRSWVRVLIIAQRKGAVVTIVYVYTALTPLRGDVVGLDFVAQRTGARLAAADV